MLTNTKFDQNKKTGYLKPANKYTIWKAAGLLMIGLLLTCSFFVFYFVYQYSYTTISNANAIMTISSNLGVDLIDNKNFIISQNIINLKNSLPPVGDKIRNIFYYDQVSTSTTSTGKNK